VSDIRTPEDEIDRPGFFYPPFTEGWWYQGITYGGHSDYSVDWNRRTKNGDWLQDAGDPVFAQADGTVAEIEREGGAVYINHFGGLWRTESRHMDDIAVKVGDKVKRGDLIGKIGKVGLVASPGFTPSEHLHCVHWKRGSLGEPFKRTKQSFYGEPVRTSVWNSDSKPSSWDAPEAVMIQGPPPRATWESTAREALKKLATTERRLTFTEGVVRELRQQIDSAPAGDEALKAQVEQLQLDLAELQTKYDSLKPAIDALVQAYAS
jgi:hypothetical protein